MKLEKNTKKEATNTECPKNQRSLKRKKLKGGGGEFEDLLKGTEVKRAASWRRTEGGVNIPNMPIWHGRLPGDRGGFRWWRWCVRT